MEFSQIVPMISVLLGGIIGFLSATMARRRSQRDFLGRRELEFRERQLAELYGPIYGYLKSQKDLYDMWMERKLDERNLEIKQLFMRQNEIVRNVIISRVYLIDSAGMPEYFVRFLSNTLIWDMYAGASADGVVPEKIKQDKRSAYPEDFNQHVFRTTVRLKKRIEELNARFAISLTKKASENLKAIDDHE